MDSGSIPAIGIPGLPRDGCGGCSQAPCVWKPWMVLKGPAMVGLGKKKKDHAAVMLVGEFEC